jgi:two-component system, LytTR family, sensor kinase
LNSYKTNRPFFLESSYNHWIRFKIDNTTADTLDLLLFAGLYHKIVLFEDNSIKKAGLLTPINERLFTENQYLIPIKILPNIHKEYYLNINDKNGIFRDTKLSLLTYEFEEKSRARKILDNKRDSFFAASFLASGIFLIVFCLIQLYQNRNIAFLFYALYLFAIELYFIRRLEGQNNLPIIFSYYPSSFYLSEVSLNIFPYICYLLFCFYILDLNRVNHALLFKITRNVIVFLIAYWIFDCIILFGFGMYPLSMFLYFWVRILLLIPIIYLLISYLKLNDIVAKYISIGSFVLLICTTLSLLMAYYRKKSGVNFLFGTKDFPLLEIGIFIENLFFIIALVAKIKKVHDERNDALNLLVEQANQQRVIAEYREKLSKAELKSFQSQINPHFIFNSLNSIKGYILKEKPKDAVKYLTDFANLIRSVLQKSQSSMISLEDEIEILKLYIELEQMRFDNKFKVEYVIDNQVDLTFIKIPALLLQPYIENAIWHGLMHKEGEGKLSIEISKQSNDIICLIDDNGIGREKSIQYKNNLTTKHKSLGLQINQDRVHVLNELNNYNISIEIIDKKSNDFLPTGTSVYIKIPM